MRTDLFDFDLPAERIALRPASPRDSAKMLVVQGDGVLRDRQVSELPQWLAPGDQLVVNDTKVISAQLKGRRIGRETEPKIEATLIKRLDGSRWQALVKPAKKLARGDRIRFGNEGKVCLLGHLDAEVEAKGAEGEVTLSFSFHGPALDQAIADLGATPLPPYIASKRTPDEQDAADYQTMFAAN
jgi:S-adenosylmethionine:tRNA ribosyltransferase-isomerase